MTHESFKQILSWSDRYTKEQVCSFLDGAIEDALLESWFVMWQKGHQRQMFNQIHVKNRTRAEQQKNQPETIPRDFDKPRGQSNDNLGAMQRQKEWRLAQYNLRSKKRK